MIAASGRSMNLSTTLHWGRTRAQPEPLADIVAHGLKIVGGAAGGFFLERRRKNLAAPLTRQRPGL